MFVVFILVTIIIKTNTDAYEQNITFPKGYLDTVSAECHWKCYEKKVNFKLICARISVIKVLPYAETEI